MASHMLSDENLRKLRLASIRPYVESEGWHSKQLFRNVLAVFERDANCTDQLLVPTNPSYEDFSEQMRTVVCKIAAAQKRSPDAVMQDLLSLDVDTLRFTVKETKTGPDTLPLEQGLSLLEGARRSLLAAACTVLSPDRTYHPRMSMGLAQEFVRVCELGQTEPGSFTIAVRCPLAASDLVVDKGGASEVPFARRATETLVGSLVRLVQGMDQDRVDTLLQGTPDSAPITANLCEARLLMQPERENEKIRISVSWARSFPASIADDQVTLRGDHFPQISRLGRQLRARIGLRIERFLAQVDELRGVMSTEGHRQGEVRLTVYHEDEAVKARVNLDPARYAIALEAHVVGQYVVVTGVLDRGPRISTLTDVAQFEAVEQGRQIQLEL